MRIVYFTHSLVSCWNHGNAHFQRGVLRALAARGLDVIAYEPAQSWSRTNLVADQGEAAAEAFAQHYPMLSSRTYCGDASLEAAVDGADVVIVHEWNEPSVVAAVGRLRRQNRFMLLFHDTHHRAVSDPDAIRVFDLTGYDAVLAFGATLAQVYERWGWGGRVFVWHEAADTALFHPPSDASDRKGAVWIGNWGDGERSEELETFLLGPASRAHVPLDIYGVRYPAEARAMLDRHGARYHGWLANAAVPDVFARHAFTVHVPRRFYTQALPGIPTIRVFEALACGIPLITAPWSDSEGLFRPGEDYLVARDGTEMTRNMRALLEDKLLAESLAASGLSQIRARHTCEVRADELLSIVAALTRSSEAA